MYQGFHRRFIHIAIQTKNGQLLDRGMRQCVAEPPLQKADLVIKQVEAPKVLLHLLYGNSQLRRLMEGIPCICRILLWVWLW